jgi:hypothetical protein
MVRQYFRTLTPILPLVTLAGLLQSATTTGLTTITLPEATTAERALLAESYVNQKLWVWQRHLKLQNWNITIRMCGPSELKPRTLGNIHWDAEKRSAVIRVLDSQHYKMPYRDMLDDMEFTVVHELIHLQLSSLPRSEASRSAEEQAVNRIAEALLKLDRR